MTRPSDAEIRRVINDLREIVYASVRSSDDPLSAITAGIASDALAWALGEPQMVVDGDPAPSFLEMVKELKQIDRN